MSMHEKKDGKIHKVWYTVSDGNAPFAQDIPLQSDVSHPIFQFYLSKEDFMSTQYSCDTCSNFRYDEDYEEYVCMANAMDEDDYSRLMSGTVRECPYYHFDNEYDLVKKQM